MRVVVDARVRRVGSRPPRELERARLRFACDDVLVEQDASTSWLPIVCTGFSDVIGSWKIIAMSLPRISRSRSAGGCQQVLALEERLARWSRAAASG